MFLDIKKLYKEKGSIDQILVWFFNAIFVLLIIFGAYISIKMNRGGRSLWFDEIALVESITNRSLTELLASGLDNCQSAPAIWLYIVKILIIVLGNNEFNLRLISVFSYIVTVLLACVLGRNIFKSLYPMAYGAFVALIGFFVKYSIVCKPYESDALCVLLVIFTFYLYSKDKINRTILSIIWAILIWVSNPVCFFEGGLLLAYMIPHLLKKEWRRIFQYILTGIIIVVSFIINYFVWLRQSVGYMQDYWEGSQWPLFITSSQDYHSLRLCIDVVFGVYDKAKIAVLILFLLGLVISIVKKHQFVIGIYLGFLITIFASTIGFFPVSDRLWCFAYPLIAILSMGTISQIIDVVFKNKVICGIVTAIILSLLIGTQTGWRYLYSFNLWWKNEEINAELDYLESVITKDDNIYITTNAYRGYMYKYRDGQILDVVLSERGSDDVSGIVEDIITLDNCYIVTTHYSYTDEDEPLTEVFHILDNKGNVQLVYYDHFTALVYYCSDASNKKIEVNPDDYWY